MPAARARSSPLMSVRDATTTLISASTVFAPISSMKFWSVVPPPLTRTASLIGFVVLMRSLRRLPHRFRVAERQIGKLRVPPNVGTPLPASSAGLVCVATVHDHHGYRGTLGALLCEAVGAGADDVFEIRAERLQAAAQRIVVHLVDHLRVERLVEPRLLLELVELQQRAVTQLHQQPPVLSAIVGHLHLRRNR